MNVASKSFKNMVKFKFFGTLVINENCVHEESKTY